MASLGYQTTLIRGAEGQREGSMDDLALALGVRPRRIASLRRELGPWDIRALIEIWRLMRRTRPDIVHTHAAKAGTLGRLAALAATWPPPVTVHTFHGHVLEGYFSGPRARIFRLVERFLAKRTSRLIAVSSEVRADLVRLRVAPSDKISIVPLGLDLERFLLPDAERASRRAAFREATGIQQQRTLVTLVARLVPIKRVDRFLTIASRLAANDAELHFMIVGDGELRDVLLGSPAAAQLGSKFTWAGFTNRLEEVYFGSDLVVLTSDNEGTPVSLIEAHAAALPVVSTDVGGVRAVVQDGVSGFVVPPDDVLRFADAALELTSDPAKARCFGRAGRDHVTKLFTLDRLVADLDVLYRDLLERVG